MMYEGEVSSAKLDEARGFITEQHKYKLEISKKEKCRPLA